MFSYLYYCLFRRLAFTLLLLHIFNWPKAAWSRMLPSTGSKYVDLLLTTQRMCRKRGRLSESDHEAVFMFGCSAHILNLLMKDFQVKSALDKILPVIKYFRNVHKAVSWLREKELPRKFSSPNDTRWSSTRDGLTSYIEA